MNNLFENFLRDKHASFSLASGDNLSDDFENWLETLEGEDYLRLGNEALKQERGRNLPNEVINALSEDVL